MRYTEEANPDVREVPAGQVWVGVIDKPVPHVALATASKEEDDLTVVCRLKPEEARQMGEELIRVALTVIAADN